MNIREAKAIIAKAENEYQKKLANEVHLKMADLGAPAKTLLGAGIGAGLGAGASFLGSEFVGMPKEDDPDLAALKLKRRRLGALLAGAGMGSLGGAVVGNVGVLDNMLTPTDTNAPNTNGPSAMEKWKGDLGKWWNKPHSVSGWLTGIGGTGLATVGVMSDRAAAFGSGLRKALFGNGHITSVSDAARMPNGKLNFNMKTNPRFAKLVNAVAEKESISIAQAQQKLMDVKATKTVPGVKGIPTQHATPWSAAKPGVQGKAPIPSTPGVDNRIVRQNAARALRNAKIRGKIRLGGGWAALISSLLLGGNELFNSK
jgi:hypothetical protein